MIFAEGKKKKKSCPSFNFFLSCACSFNKILWNLPGQNTPLQPAFMFGKFTRVLLNLVCHDDYSYLLLTFISIFCLGSPGNGSSDFRCKWDEANLRLTGGLCVELKEMLADVCYNHGGSHGETQVGERGRLCLRLNRNNSVRSYSSEYRFSSKRELRSRRNKRCHTSDRVKIDTTSPALQDYLFQDNMLFLEVLKLNTKQTTVPMHLCSRQPLQSLLAAKALIFLRAWLNEGVR